MQRTIDDKDLLLESGKMRVKIDAEWTANDFASMFSSLNKLYNLYGGIFEGIIILNQDKKDGVNYSDSSHSPLAHFRLRNLLIKGFYNQEGIYFKELDILSEKFPFGMKVSKIQYASPGFTDLSGIAAVFGHLKDILIHYFPNKKDKEEVKKLEQERIQLQIANLKEMGFDSVEIKKIMLLEEMELKQIKLLVEQKKITSIEIESEDKK